MKQNEHVMTWLNALRDEATHPACSMARMIEVIGILGRYSAGARSV